MNIFESLSKEIRITAGCAVIDGDGNILLIKTKKGWELPKGHVKSGESLEEAATREVKEETGINCEVVSQLGSFISNDKYLIIYHAKYIRWAPQTTVKRRYHES